MDKQKYLSFDDVCLLKELRAEHFGFTETISQVANCLEITDLLHDVLSDDSVKDNFMSDLASLFYNLTEIIPVDNNLLISNLLSSLFKNT